MQVLEGDKVIVMTNGKPVVTTVTRVTRSGQFKTEATGVSRYKLAWGDQAKLVDGGYKDKYIRICPYTDEKLAELSAECEKREAEKAAERAANEAKRDAREAERQAQIDAIKILVPNVNAIELGTASPMPDGSRVYQHTFATRPFAFTAKDEAGNEVMRVNDRGWIWAIITCRDVEEYDWKSDGNDKVNMVEMAMTFRNARNSGSFSSVSTTKYKTEEEAVYDGLRYAYHECW